jgi:hypothetical protein
MISALVPTEAFVGEEARRRVVEAILRLASQGGREIAYQSWPTVTSKDSRDGLAGPKALVYSASEMEVIRGPFRL